MMTKKIVVAFAIITTLSSNAKGDERSKSCNTLSTQGYTVDVEDVCVTTYSSTEPGADKGTSRGLGSIGVKLKEFGPKSVGSIAIDRRVFPYGTRIIVTTKRGEVNRFLCVDTGGDVKSRKASRLRAKKAGLGDEYAKRPVIDIYTRKHYPDEWATVVVIRDKNPLDPKDPEFRTRLKERMSIDFWPKDSRELALRALRLREAAYLAQR